MKFCWNNDRENIYARFNKINNVLEKVTLVITTELRVVERNLIS
jgi:hypothetical protein